MEKTLYCRCGHIVVDDKCKRCGKDWLPFDEYKNVGGNVRKNIRATVRTKSGGGIRMEPIKKEVKK